jgi:aminoglycoside phosphotransferase (APT) family kinase protein
MTMHENELTVTVDTVRNLVDRQFPDWAALPIVRVRATGTVNAIFRIGDGLAARLPLQPGDVAEVHTWLVSEADAARELLGHTRFPTPEPIAIGEPSDGYPLPWSVQTWLPGTVATPDDRSLSAGFVADIAELINDIRSIPSNGRVFSGTGRGGNLQTHDEWMETCFRRSGTLVDVPRLRAVWRRLRELPHRAPDVMTHGDLIPGNLLVEDGRLVGVLDVGGLGPADPALDLVAAWHLLEPGPRSLLRDALGCDELEWERGKAWAFEQAIGAVWYYVESNPAMSRMGWCTLERIIDDEAH